MTIQNKHSTVTFFNSDTSEGFLVAKRANMTLVAGITPSAATVITVPQTARLPETGTLTFKSQNLDGVPAVDDVTITFLDCAVNQASLRLEDGAYTWSIQIVDRRWKWQFGEINGFYNTRLKDGSVDPETEKTPQELADLLFIAMGEDEQGGTFPPDFSLLPNDSRTKVEWDRANPARELANLCEALGCIVVLQLNNRVKIWPIGQGVALPLTIDEVSEQGLAMLYTQTPSDLRLIGAPVEFQTRLLLEAVGLDTDDEIKLLADLSYADDVTATADEVHFIEIADPDTRERARRSCYRWYRVKEIRGTAGPFVLPGTGDTLTGPEQIQLLAGLIQEVTFYGAKKDRKSPILYGNFLTEDSLEETADGVYLGSFTVDTAKSLIKMSKPFKSKADESIAVANAEVEIAYTALRGDGAPIRYQKDKTVPVGTHATQNKLLRQDEVVRTVRIEYTKTFNGLVTDTIDNLTAADTEADHYLDAEISRYGITDTDNAKFGGLIKINVDGINQSVSWIVGGGPARTAASADPRANPFVANFDDKRRLEHELDRRQNVIDLFERLRQQNNDRARDQIFA